MIPRRFHIATTAAAALAASPSCAQTAPDAASLLAAEDALFAADVTHDTEAIRRGFADEAVFVHANGLIQTKGDYLRATEAHAFPIRSVSAADRVVRIDGPVGVVRGRKLLTVGEMDLSGTYLSVYLFRDGAWRLLDSQSSPEFHPGPQH